MSDKWLLAAIIGSIWASIEIIIGSFLHNLRLPMTGIMLKALLMELGAARCRVFIVLSAAVCCYETLVGPVGI